jgi:hypothetical protein
LPYSPLFCDKKEPWTGDFHYVPKSIHLWGLSLYMGVALHPLMSYVLHTLIDSCLVSAYTHAIKHTCRSNGSCVAWILTHTTTLPPLGTHPSSYPAGGGSSSSSSWSEGGCFVCGRSAFIHPLPPPSWHLLPFPVSWVSHRYRDVGAFLTSSCLCVCAHVCICASNDDGFFPCATGAVRSRPAARSNAGAGVAVVRPPPLTREQITNVQD